MKQTLCFRRTLCVLFLSLLTAQAQDLDIVFMHIAGSTTQLKGEVIQKGREGLHKVLAYSHEIISPRDPASGQATGRRQHQPFRVVKRLNQSSPLLLNAIANKEKLKAVTIDVWGVSTTGIERKMLTYTLTGAEVISLRPWMPNKSDLSANNYPAAEEVAFSYDSITVTWVDGGVTATDTWSATVKS